MKGYCGSHGKGTFLRTLMGVMATCHGKKVDPSLPFQMKDLANLSWLWQVSLNHKIILIVIIHILATLTIPRIPSFSEIRISPLITITSFFL